MKRSSIAFLLALFATASTMAAAPDVSAVLDSENKKSGFDLTALSSVDDLTFLRRVSVDLIGRIPTGKEIDQFLSWSKAERRTRVVDKLINDDRFIDTWTTFYADMLRLRSNAPGGAAALAYVHQSLREGMPHDELCHSLISATGKAGATPEVGFVLGDNADPMALAGVTSQVFMGIRVACAECHDHPFDKWTRRDFYEFAAFFGKTRRVESQFTRTVYTTEADQTTVLWPPEGEADAADRKPLKPEFLFSVTKPNQPSPAAARLIEFRKRQAALLAAQTGESQADSSIDDLLEQAADKADRAAKGGAVGTTIVDEARAEARNLNVKSGLIRQSDLRLQLADFVTSPENTYFSQSFTNRVWKQLVGRGFVEPIDDFSDSNPPSHPQTLKFLTDEFVAHGFDFKFLVRSIVLSQPYQLEHAFGVDELTRGKLEAAFFAAPVRRMQSEALFDSIVTAGHLFDVKHPAGQNMKVVWQQQRIAKEDDESGESLVAQQLNTDSSKPPAMRRSLPTQDGASPTYDLEQAIAVDFDAILKKAKNAEADESAEVERMNVMSKEEIEAMRMAAQMQDRRRNIEYIDRFIKSELDDNPRFASAYRMASPVNPEHFLRVFGQTDRVQLGDTRKQNPTMRQALMMLNGRLTHEASRVGQLEKLYQLLQQSDYDAAVQLAYQEILTRRPTAEELNEAKQIIQDSGSAEAGMADLRWVLLNCNEFRFLP